METVRRYVDAGNANWITAWAKSDASILANSFDAEGAILADGGVIIRGKESIQKMMQGSMDDNGSVICTIETTGLWIDGDIAFERGNYTYTFNNKDGKRTIGGKYIVLWKRQADGSWLFYRDIGLPG